MSPSRAQESNKALSALSGQEQEWADQYLYTGSKSAAFRIAYDCTNLSQKDIHIRAMNVGRRPHIKTYLEAELLARREDNRVSLDRVIEQYAALAFTDLPGIIEVEDGTVTITDTKNLTAAQRACIRSISVRDTRHGQHVEVTLVDKSKPLEALMRHLGGYAEHADKHQGLSINLNIGTPPKPKQATPAEDATDQADEATIDVQAEDLI